MKDWLGKKGGHRDKEENKERKIQKGENKFRRRGCYRKEREKMHIRDFQAKHSGLNRKI